MTVSLPVAADSAALERFAFELFCGAAEATPPDGRQTARLRAAAITPARLEDQLNRSADAAPPAIPLAYRLWLAHLLWLEEVLHTLDSRPAEVTAAELAGLQAVARARAQFLRAYEFCPRCQAPNRRGSARCRHCHSEY